MKKVVKKIWEKPLIKSNSSINQTLGARIQGIKDGKAGKLQRS